LKISHKFVSLDITYTIKVINDVFHLLKLSFSS